MPGPEPGRPSWRDGRPDPTAPPPPGAPPPREIGEPDASEPGAPGPDTPAPKPDASGPDALPPGPGDGTADAAPAGGAPPTAERETSGRSGRLRPFAVAAASLACVGVAIGAWAVLRPDDHTGGLPTPSPAASRPAGSPSPGGQSPSGQSPGGQSPTSSGSQSASAGATKHASRPGNELGRGDCLVNDGTDQKPRLREVACGPDTWEVLARIPFTTDDAQCDKSIGGAGGRHDSTYTHDQAGSIGDYVLCLRQR